MITKKERDSDKADRGYDGNELEIDRSEGTPIGAAPSKWPVCKCGHGQGQHINAIGSSYCILRCGCSSFEAAT